jgi:hypothetical protein
MSPFVVLPDTQLSFDAVLRAELTIVLVLCVTGLALNYMSIYCYVYNTIKHECLTIFVYNHVRTLKCSRSGVKCSLPVVD